MDRLPTSVAALARELAALDGPPTPSASPAARASWHSLKTAARALEPHLRRLFRSRSPSPEEPTPRRRRRSPSPAPRRRPRSKRETVDSRVLAIVPAFGDPPLDPDDVVAVLSALPAGARPKIEEAALGALCRGYDAPDPHDWTTALAVLAAPAPAVSATSREIDALDTVGARLLRRHDLLHRAAAAEHARSWSAHLVRQLEALKFALDWAQLLGPGANNQKSAFFKTVYARDVLANAVADPVAFVDAHHSDDYRAWRRTIIEPVVTGRNRLLQLYHAFGAAVLLDPVWAATELASSRDFAAVLAALVEATPEAPDPPGEPSVAATLLPRHESSSRVLLAVAQVLAGGDIHDELGAFLEDHPPSYTL